MTTPPKASAGYDLSWSRPNTMAVLAGCVLLGGLLWGQYLAKPHAVGKQIGLWGLRIRAATERINPNTASAGSLQRLPGIGPSRAATIVDYRQTHGPVAFRQATDLTAIKGIGAATAAKAKPHLKFESDADSRTTKAKALNQTLDGP